MLQDPAPTASTAPELVEERLAAVEAMFRENLASPTSIVREIGSFVAEGEGKRVRPTLHLLCARLCGYEGPHDVLIATVMEFIHSATLIHDDIIDEATTRRGRPSVNYRWGNNITVLFGDYMFAKAMEMALRAESLAIMDRLADVTLRMTEGEMLQTRYVGRIDLSVDEYLGLVERKTAALFACSCETAGLLAGLDEDGCAALAAYGLDLGFAFQIVDDILDFTADSETLGKPTASDLREGKVTLPLIDLLTGGSERARSLARTIMDAGRPDSPEIAELTDLLRSSGALDRARLRARGYAERAAEGLNRFAAGPARTALQGLPGLLLRRER
jgi:octaprenyl-diphosphate synthase